MTSEKEIYFSFFMFTADLQPDNRQYTATIVNHMKSLGEFGYTGFDLPIAPTATLDHRSEIKSYEGLKQALDAAGLGNVKFTTNVAATRTFDPSSLYKEQRDIALDYLKSRVDITKALGGDIMAGPIVLPYGVFPTTDSSTPIWSDALQDWLVARYKAAQPVIEELGKYAATKGVKVAIEPVDHWETGAPNLVRDVVDFLGGVESAQVGVCIDSAHVVLGSDGPHVFTSEIAREDRLHYVHISAPDRGAVRDSWIPWKLFLKPILNRYKGPYLIEVFNAIPVFLNGLRLTRKKFWIEGEDQPVVQQPSAYTVAKEAINELREEITEVKGMKK
jgi:sugar phosphate isomerase/epimerase